MNTEVHPHSWRKTGLQEGPGGKGGRGGARRPPEPASRKPKDIVGNRKSSRQGPATAFTPSLDQGFPAACRVQMRPEGTGSCPRPAHLLFGFICAGLLHYGNMHTTTMWQQRQHEQTFMPLSCQPPSHPKRPPRKRLSVPTHPTPFLPRSPHSVLAAHSTDVHLLRPLRCTRATAPEVCPAPAPSAWKNPNPPHRGSVCLFTPGPMRGMGCWLTGSL